MTENWFEQKEIMAGTKRLVLSYYLYKIFGKWILKIIAFFVATAAYISNKERRNYSIEFFNNLEEYTKTVYFKKFSSYLQFLNYGYALVDKIVAFSKNLKLKDFKFEDKGIEEISELIKNKKGILFLTTHIGNAEIMRFFAQSDFNKYDTKINIFLEKKHCEIFNNFLDKVKIKDERIKTYSVEEIEVTTAFELSQKLENGELVFIAGDRICATNPDKTYDAKFLNKNIKLPIGALKLANALEVPVFCIVCAKDKDYYSVHTKKIEFNKKNKKEMLEKLKKEYSIFLEEYAIKYPYHFFHFYDFFKGK